MSLFNEAAVDIYDQPDLKRTKLLYVHYTDLLDLWSNEGDAFGRPKDWQLRWVFNDLVNRLTEEMIFDIACHQMGMIVYKGSGKPMRDWLVRRTAYIIQKQLFCPFLPELWCHTLKKDWHLQRDIYSNLPGFRDKYPYPEPGWGRVRWLDYRMNSRTGKLNTRSLNTSQWYVEDVLMRYVSDRATEKLFVWNNGVLVRNFALLDEFAKWASGKWVNEWNERKVVSEENDPENYYLHLEVKYNELCTDIVTVMRAFVKQPSQFRVLAPKDTLIRSNVNRLCHYVSRHNNKVPRSAKKW